MTASEAEQNRRRLAELERELDRAQPSRHGPLRKEIAETTHAIAAADRKGARK